MPKKNKLKNQFKTEEVKVFKQFKKQQLFKQITFVFAAMAIGFGMNSFVLDGDFGTNLKANILETKQHKNIEKKADLYIEKTEGKNSNLMKLIAGENIDNVKTLSFSFTYNPEEVEIQDIFPNIDTTMLENEKGITTFIINFENPKKIKIGNEIINFYVSKKLKTSQNLNLINANITDSNNSKYDLTTSGIIF